MRSPAQIVNLANGIILADNATFAGSFPDRLRGLMFRESLAEGECLVIRPCKIIHSFGVRFSLDVVFVSKDNEAVHQIENFRPGRVSPFVFKSSLVLELPAGTIKKTGTQKGHRLSIG